MCEGRIHCGTHWPRRAYPTRPFLGAKMAIEVTALAAVASPSYATSFSSSSSSSFTTTVFSVTGEARLDETLRAVRPVGASSPFSLR